MKRNNLPLRTRRLVIGGCGLVVAAALAVIARRGLRFPERLKEADGPRLDSPGPSRLAERINRLTARHPARSGVHLLPDPRDAFAARVLLARRAERMLDLQYYIWTRDRSGTILLKEIIDSAERGVQVRLLIDDHGTTGMDDILSALATHREIKVRLFNPFPWRIGKLAAFLFEFSRLNRRMHNKSFTADGAATIVGGRNIGDAYFGASEGALLADLDLIAIGAVVDDVERSFDDYWASARSIPVEQLVGERPAFMLQSLRREAEQMYDEDASVAYRAAIEALPIMRQIVDGSIALEWATVRLVVDPVAKAEGTLAEVDLPAARLKHGIGDPKTRLTLVSAYFVPGKAMVAELTNLARRGVDVRIVTNGSSATDVGMVFAYYAKYRLALVSGGVRLFEFRRAATVDHPATWPWRASGKASAAPSGSKGSGVSSLHAKTFVLDGKRLYVGSFNLDPRSFSLNTELGLIIDSPTLAAEVDRQLDRNLPASAYEVVATAGRLTWTAGNHAEQQLLTIEPGMTRTIRLAIRILERLPLEWLT